MKTIRHNLIFIFVLFVVVWTCLAIGWQPNIPQAAMTVKVVNEAGDAVSNALVGIGFDQGYDYKNEKSVAANFKGISDTNGLFSAGAKMLNSKVRGSVQKEGYYKSSFEYAFKQDRQTLEWDPSHVTNTVVLKEIKNPIPMYVKQIRLGIPEYDKPIGFDLDKGDWVAPYGCGIHTDLIAYAECDNPNDMLDRNFRMTVSFPNEKDGIIADGVYDSNSGSRLKSDHMAPEGGYEPKWLQVMHYTTQKKIEYNYDSNRKYYFRVRTKLDEHGNLISAQYGKIYGDFFVLTYYLNPTPNDRNVEFDPDKNLFGGTFRFAP